MSALATEIFLSCLTNSDVGSVEEAGQSFPMPKEELGKRLDSLRFSPRRSLRALLPLGPRRLELSRELSDLLLKRGELLFLHLERGDGHAGVAVQIDHVVL